MGDLGKAMSKNFDDHSRTGDDSDNPGELKLKYLIFTWAHSADFYLSYVTDIWDIIKVQL